MQLLSQRDPRWSNHLLGNAPSLGLYGCLVTDFAMIANDSGHPCNPATLDELFTAKHLYVNGDLATDNMLDRCYPSEYSTRVVPGFAAADIRAAVPSKDTYAVLFISTPSVPTHFVIAYSADGRYIADPWTGKVGTLAGYGGPTAVRKTVLIRKIAAPQPVVPTPPPTPPPPKPVPVPEDVLPGLVHQVILDLVALILLLGKK